MDAAPDLGFGQEREELFDLAKAGKLDDAAVIDQQVRRLLNDKRSGRFSPERLQLLVFTLAGAGYYVQLAAEQENTLEMPPVPDELLILVGASHSLYLGGKTFSMLRGLLGRV